MNIHIYISYIHTYIHTYIYNIHITCIYIYIYTCVYECVLDAHGFQTPILRLNVFISSSFWVQCRSFTFLKHKSRYPIVSISWDNIYIISINQ